MIKTRAVKFSDAEIRRLVADLAVQDLRDPQYPGLYLRFGQDRQSGWWYLVKGRAEGKRSTDMIVLPSEFYDMDRGYCRIAGAHPSPLESWDHEAFGAA